MRVKYPVVDDNSPDWSDGNNARTAVWACDWMLPILRAKKSQNGHTISERELAQLMRQFALVHEMALHLLPTFKIGFNQRVVRLLRCVLRN